MDPKILKAICEPKRFLLLQLMAERGFCVRALARKSQLTESAVSQHIKVLREAGLVYGLKRGYYTHYGLNKEALGKFIEELESIKNTECKPCGSPFFGCSEAEHIKCGAYEAYKNKERD